MAFLAMDLVIETPYGWTVLRVIFAGTTTNAVAVPCGWDYEASWKIGYGFGPSPELIHFSNPRSREPAITCGHVLDPSASFVADPILFIPAECKGRRCLLPPARSARPALLPLLELARVAVHQVGLSRVFPNTVAKFARRTHPHRALWAHSLAHPLRPRSAVQTAAPVTTPTAASRPDRPADPNRRACPTMVVRRACSLRALRHALQLVLSASPPPPSGVRRRVLSMCPYIEISAGHLPLSINPMLYT